ncbi:MAG: FGGY-family carbohydrate kinase [Gemmataceae bacterium]
MPEPLRCVPESTIIVGWDFSTSAVKALAFNLRGNVVARSWFKNDVWTDYTPAPANRECFIDSGNREINLMQLEGQARASAREIEALLEEEGFADEWLAAGISATHHTAGWIDANHNPIRRAICWDDQTLARYHAIGLERLGGPDAVRKLIGGPWAVRYSLSHLVKDGTTFSKKDWQRAEWMMGHGPLAAGYLTGKFGVTSVSSAASTGILNLKTDQWQYAMLGAVGDPDLQTKIASCLPKVVETFRPIGKLAGSEWMDLVRIELPKGMEFQRPLLFPTLDDQAAGLVGGGATQPGELAIILGTSAVVNSSASAAPTTDSLDAMKLGWDNAYLWMRCYSNGAGFAESVEPVKTRIEVEPEAERLPPGCDGVSVLPFLNSEPSLGINQKRIEWTGDATSKPVRVRAAYEAIAYLIALGVRAHQDAGQKITRITVSGGLGKSKLMCEILASVLAGVLPRPLPLVRLVSDEGSALGAAVLALAGLEATMRAERGIEEPFTIADATAKLVHEQDRVSARGEWIEGYRRLLAEFEKRIHL